MKAAIIAITAIIIAGPAEAGSARRVRAAIDAPPGHGFTIPGFGLAASASRYIGTNPTGLAHRWCGRFMRLALRAAGRADPGPNFDQAARWSRIGRPGVAGPDAVAVWGHHVAIIVRLTRPGHALMISGNDGPAGGRLVLERERSLAGARIRYL